MANHLVRQLVTDSLPLLVTGLFLCFPARAMSRIQPQQPDDASRLLAQVGETYHQLASYRFSGNVLIRSRLNPSNSVEEFVMSARTAPGRYRLQFGLGFSRVLITCDGSKAVVHVAETNQHVETAGKKD